MPLKRSEYVFPVFKIMSKMGPTTVEFDNYFYLEDHKSIPHEQWSDTWAALFTIHMFSGRGAGGKMCNTTSPKIRCFFVVVGVLGFFLK